MRAKEKSVPKIIDKAVENKLKFTAKVKEEIMILDNVKIRLSQMNDEISFIKECL